MILKWWVPFCVHIPNHIRNHAAMTSTSKNGPGSVCVSKIYEWYKSCLTFTNGKKWCNFRTLSPNHSMNLFKYVQIYNKFKFDKKLQTFFGSGETPNEIDFQEDLAKEGLKNSKASRVQFPTNSVATFEVLTPIVKVWCLFKVVSGGPSALTAQKFRCQMLMCISTAQVRSKWFATFTSALRSFFELCPLFVENLGHARHSEVQNVVVRDRRRTSDTVSSAWQARHLLHVVKTLAGGGRN